MYPYDRHTSFRGRLVDLALEEHAQREEVHTPAELRPLADQLENRMRVLGYASSDLFAVKLALYEAVINAFRHGNRRDPHKRIQVRYLVNGAEVLLEVEDEGPGFDPTAVPDPLAGETIGRPGGRGLFLMRVYMSWVSFNREGNRVTLARQRSGS
jgi:serine/threonine-protein kinase RsbW